MKGCDDYSDKQNRVLFGVIVPDKMFEKAGKR
jgi:hypothetical protein